jgi:hypothetical protein
MSDELGVVLVAGQFDFAHQACPDGAVAGTKRRCAGKWLDLPVDAGRAEMQRGVASRCHSVRRDAYHTYRYGDQVGAANSARPTAGNRASGGRRKLGCWASEVAAQSWPGVGDRPDGASSSLRLPRRREEDRGRSGAGGRQPFRSGPNKCSRSVDGSDAGPGIWS